jgi:hypothetical protein
MKRRTMIFAVMTAAAVFLAPVSSHAFTYDFTCVISGTGCAPSGMNFGSFSVTDAADGKVSVEVNLANTDWKLLQFGFNFEGPPAPGTFSFDGGTSITYNPDGIKPDGYPYFFDLQIPSTGNLGNVSSFSDLLALSTGDLSEGNFHVLDSGGFLYAYAHIGSFGETGEDSIWVGAPPVPPQVPEPGTALLLGMGLLGLAGLCRRKLRA